MKVLIIGGTGHVGSFLAPQLNAEGYEVVVATSGRTKPHTKNGWDGITFVTASVDDNEKWRNFVKAQQAEVIVDFPGRAVSVTYEAAKSSGKHFIACGSLWMFGEPKVVPTPEIAQADCFSQGYVNRFNEMNRLIPQAKKDGIAFSTIMPPNICGPGKIPLDLSGGRSEDIHKAHSRGERVIFPEGCNTLIGPCDASDIARAFMLAIAHRDAAAGEMFNVGSDYALTTTQLVETFGDIYGTTIPIEYVSYKKYTEEVLPEMGAHYHFTAHMLPDLTKIKTKIGYKPRFTPEQTLARAIDWMRASW